MKFHDKHTLTFIVTAAAILSLASPTYASASPNDRCDKNYPAAAFPKTLLGLGISACPTSKNAKRGKTLIKQLYWAPNGNLNTFGKNYTAALMKHGWRIDKKKAGHYKKIPKAEYYSLTATHPEGLVLQFACSTLFRQPHPLDNNAKTQPATGFDISITLSGS